jgi:hypothetical protein
MPRVPSRIGEADVLGLLREGLRDEADRIWFRAGCAPLAVGHGFARALAFRQLAADDVAAVAELMLRGSYVPQRLADASADAGHELPVLCELPGEAILETRIAREDGGLVVMVEIARPLVFPEELEFS